MKLTKVEAGSMQEALRKIRSTLGDDAMIVGTRSFRRGGVLGVGGREVVEVYVTDPRPERAEKESLRSADPYQNPSSRQGAAAPEPGRGDGSSIRRSRPSPARGTEHQNCPEGTKEYQSLSNALGQLREEIRGLVREKEEIPDQPFLRDAYSLLLEREVDPKLASRIVNQLKALPLPVGLPNSNRVRAVVAAQLRNLFLPNVTVPVSRPPRVVVLIGPTGVGKTTTIAKLAARAKLTDGRRVGLVTLDTFRIGAVDQLHKYGQIIGIPLGVVSDPVEFQSVVKTYSKEGVEVVYVDSAGRSQRDELKMTELREFLQVLPEAEVHLVLSTTTNPKILKNVVERFSRVGFHRVILTKLDETTCFGAMLETLVRIGKPVSFLTDGQNVPDDIMTSDPERLADLTLRPIKG